MEKIRPMLFTTLKKYSGAQLMSDVVAGIIVAIIALPLIDRAGTGIRRGSGAGYLHGDRSRICDLILRRQPGTDRRTDSGLCNDRSRHRGEKRRGRAGSRNDHGRYHPCYHGILPAWFPDQVYPVYDHDRIHLRYRGDHRDRTVKGFLRCHISGRYGDYRDHAEVKSFCRRFRNHERSCD